MTEPTHRDHAAQSAPSFKEVQNALGSGAVPLSFAQWIWAAAIVIAVLAGVPELWKRIEPLPSAGDLRIPYALGNDYWLYARLSEKVMRDGRLPVIGDSVIWGEYVTPEQTLPHYLNEKLGRPLFANAGLDGSHPLALEGLVQFYGSPIQGTRVLLHFNLLWMSSKERDLQGDRETSFNHPELVPQWLRELRCYKASTAQRMGVTLDRLLPYRSLADHLRICHFDALDLQEWTVDHAYENPFARVRPGLPATDESLRHRPVPWTEQGITVQEMDWVPLESSLQYRAFRDTVRRLQSRRNQVFVLVGPFNEHMLSVESRKRYRQRKDEVARRLADDGVAHFAPEPLPSAEYADASHPLSTGYARLADWLVEDAGFREWIGLALERAEAAAE